MEDRILYLECYSGISGDMTVAALLDLGAGEEKLREALLALEVGGYEIHIGRTEKCGIRACDFEVILEESGHRHEKNTQSESARMHGEERHHHEHRSYRDIRGILERAPLDPRVRALAEKMFGIVARAEAKVHGKPVDEVHFHEVGAVDSIVDIVGAAACFVDLGIREVCISSLSEGTGTVWCQHGRIPVPAPAVAEIVSEAGLPIRITGTEGEMVTPTGAAIAAALRTRECLPASFTVEKIGIGAGKKDFPHANILRAMIIRETTYGPSGESRSRMGCTGDARARRTDTADEYQTDTAGAHRTDAAGAHQTDTVGVRRTDTAGVHQTDTAGARRTDTADMHQTDMVDAHWTGAVDPHQTGTADPDADAVSMYGRSVDEICVLETNIDDCSGEQLAWTIECLMEAGARDASCFPIYMKKNRPAWMLQVLCDEEKIPEMETVIFRETTSIGLRKYREDRSILPRSVEKIETELGSADIKVCTHKGQRFYYPEYSSIQEICRETGKSYREIYGYLSGQAAAILGA